MDNEDRIEIAQTALMTMPEEYRGEDEEEAAITDLMANLLHLARDSGLDPYGIMLAALTHYSVESEE